MAPAVAPGLDLAPLWRRPLAAAVDMIVFAGLPAAGVVAVVAVGRDDLMQGGMRRYERFIEDTNLRPVMGLAGLALAVATRNTRTPGMRTLGIRRADARTGGPIGVRPAVVHHLLGVAARRVSGRVYAPAWRRMAKRSERLRLQVDAVRREHPDEDEAMRAAYREAAVKPPRGCIWFLVPLAVDALSALLSPTGQRWPDRLAGIAVVRAIS